jgi:hypothetical protein
MRQARPKRLVAIQSVVGWVADLGALALWVVAVLAAVPIGLAILVASAFAGYAVAGVVGAWIPSSLGGILALAWIAATGGLIAFVWVRLYRRLPRRVRDAADEPIDIGGDDRPRRDPAADPDSLLARVSALDARLGRPPDD